MDRGHQVSCWSKKGLTSQDFGSLSPPAMLSFTFLSLQASVAGQDSDRPLRCDLRYLSHSSSLGGAPGSRCCWVDEALYRDGGRVSLTFIHTHTHNLRLTLAEDRQVSFASWADLTHEGTNHRIFFTFRILHSE